MKWKTSFLSLLVLGVALLTSQVQANCKSQDAKWIKGKDLLITQGSKTDPSKVTVLWTNMVENERCVDQFYIWFWKKGLERENGTKATVSSSVFSKEVTVDPCVEYNFQVELQENDLFGADIEQSKVTLFKPSAVAKILDTDKKNFYVGFDYDRVKGVHDLSNVAIRFKKSILQNPSCVKYIEIVGKEVPKQPRTLLLSGRTRIPPFLEELAPNYGIDGNYPALSRSSLSRSRGGSGKVPYKSSSSSSSSQSDYHSSHHGKPGYSYSYSSAASGKRDYHSSSSTSTSTIGGHGSYRGSKDGFGSTSGSGSGSHSSNPPSGGSSGGSSGYPGYSWGYNRRKRGLFSRSKDTTTTPRPSYRESSPITNPTGKVLPPFNQEIIEVNAKIQPCNSYKFTLKVYTPSGSILGEIQDLELPHLTEMTDYKPPMLSKLFRVEHIRNTGPVIKLQPGWGVPAACLGDFFEAVDAHVADLESDLQYHVQQVSNAISNSASLRDNLRLQKAAQLSQFGCKCNSTLLGFNTTDSGDFKKSKDVFGVYRYEGMLAGKPYYRRLHSDLAPTAGRSSLGSSLSQTATTPSTAPKKLKEETVYFMYWNPKENNWAIGTTMDGEDIQFKTKKNSVAKCPGDPNAMKTWERSGTFTWHDEPLVKASCGLRI
ncbi:uncharacterized protein LOC131888066 [Tigriopus californicus]|uniref:uncharacterized protein LOC131888066 n=1 Tax=Tigriopus californicus TaxID=6832 RepID=UPI0027D9DD81|nr:uncharacterized protein LOC131888066 [Tigriopus californicus]